MSEENSVQVAVRMRIFNKREKKASASRVVRMKKFEGGAKTYVTDPDTGKERDFTYDYSFQSHSADEEGIGEFASQDTVFETLGIPVLESALAGKNICLFAYGQTGAGKSFSMLGKLNIPDLEGIVPRACRQIFKMMEAEKDEKTKYQVEIQVVEVYCEQVNDLLANRKKWPARGHKPRMTRKDGYVVNTIRRPCLKYEDIDQAMQFADANRSVGSHALNPESSRAHTIYTIHYKKIVGSEKAQQVTQAKLNLVDLAGSERTSSAGTSGQMLKEGNAINLSLTALGGTIKALAEGKKPRFRESKLTLLLQGSMTNGLVIMIAAVSPASICYPETMSTLRFAKRVKSIKVKVTTNVTVDPVVEIKKEMEAMRAAMQEEINRLKAMTDGSAPLSDAEDSEDEIELRKQLEEERAEIERLRAELEKECDDEIAELEQTDDQREKDCAAIGDDMKDVLSLQATAESVKEPHLVNLHEDDRLSNTLVYPFKVGITKIGRKNKDSPPDLEFNGLGMQRDHCQITRTEDGKVTIKCMPNADLKVNGVQITEETELKNNMRVWIATAYSFLFRYPGKESEGEVFEDEFDYFDAQEEISKQVAQQFGDQASISTELSTKLGEALNKTNQANFIAQKLGRNVLFAPKLCRNPSGDGKNQGPQLLVTVSYGQVEFSWPWEKFLTRLLKMTQLLQIAEDAEDEGKPCPVPDEDPFTDNEHQFLGDGQVVLTSVAHMIDFDTTVPFITPSSTVEARSKLMIVPCDKNGNPGPWDDWDLDPYVESPEELLGKEICFNVVLEGLSMEENTSYSDLFIRYRLGLPGELEAGKAWHKTPILPTIGDASKLAFAKQHKVVVDEAIKDHLQNGNIFFQLYGKPATPSSTETETARGTASPTERSVVMIKQQEPLIDKESQDEWVELRGCTSQALGGPAGSIEITMDWKDQGWGNQKGRLRLNLLRQGRSVADKEIFRLAPHSWKSVIGSYYAGWDDFVDAAMAGDVVKVEYFVGGGGGHELYIEDFECKICCRSALEDFENALTELQDQSKPLDRVSVVSIYEKLLKAYKNSLVDLQSPSKPKPVPTTSTTQSQMDDMEATIKAKFDLYDKNGNGWLTRGEMEMAYQDMDSGGLMSSQEEVNKVIAKYGLFEDGRVSYDEFSLLFLQLMKA